MRTLVLLVFSFLTFNYSFAAPLRIIYNSPVDNSDLVLPSTNIIFGFENSVDDINNFYVEVTGSRSKNHTGTLLLSSENRIIIFNPDNAFVENEKVTARLFFVNDNTGKKLLNEITFKTVAKMLSKEERKKIVSEIYKEEFGNAYQTTADSFTGDTLPANFPVISVLNNSGPAEGYIYCSNISLISLNPYLMILNNAGFPVFYRKMPATCYDFKIHKNMMMTYFLNNSNNYYGMNTQYQIVDSFHCGNGYETDIHEIRFKENNNVLLMSYDPQIVNMSEIVEGGQKDAVVTGLIIQEIDANKNVVFQWRSWDHFQITDADSVNLSLGQIDYVHGNAIEIDHDGHYLISSRNMSEISKINSITGEMIYRFGGKNNQFTFINDPYRFSYQHAIRRTNAGTYTLFDNGNWHSPKFSRAVEYRINESARTAELIWEYRNDPSIYSFAMGYVERLPNGNTTISWGFSDISFTEVTPDKQKVFEMSFDTANFVYRITRSNLFIADPNAIPSDYVITSSYPNPFNGSTNIKFSLPSVSNVTLKVYNMLGEEVETILSNINYSAGTHTTRFDSNNLSSGIYFYSFLINGIQYVGKIVLLK